MINEAFGWLWLLMGFISGMIIGFKFHHADWLGGYGSHERRLVRLGHISFIGLGFLNIIFSYTIEKLSLAPNLVQLTSYAFIIGAISMPICCFLLAWKKELHLIFSIPVISIIFATLMTFVGLILTFLNQY